ncbi:rhodanese-like domain-containing protein [Streptomyces sp. AJS327]|uniref:rhodanese-like domain-containing protein n=1 Tax=Streptomyces sp. AJS327 TaxID=2545265 RepID=UPI0015DF658F|nr:rhodanese-like domain-containing protein [Streptomyces sp. AJS327]MBA0052766.1 rhodanese-like domain-containing protein [Streptomyces sp. AJS327]
MNFGPFPQMDAAEVPEDALLLDVREDDEWAAGHADGALHIPLGEVIDRLSEIIERAGATPDTPGGEPGTPVRRVHVICRVGGRSAQVTQYLLQQGLDAVNVDGGMLAWEQAGRPLVGEAQPPYIR